MIINNTNSQKMSYFQKYQKLCNNSRTTNHTNESQTNEHNSTAEFKRILCHSQKKTTPVIPISRHSKSIISTNLRTSSKHRRSHTPSKINKTSSSISPTKIKQIPPSPTKNPSNRSKTSRNCPTTRKRAFSRVPPLRSAAAK